MQQQHFEQIADGFGVADDVVANGFLAKALARRQGSLKNSQLTAGVVGVTGTHHAQRSCIIEQLEKQFAFGQFVQSRIGSLDACNGQQFSDDFFVLVGALTQVYRGQVKAEHIDRTNQRPQALGNQCLAMVGLQRGFDGAQIGQKLTGIFVRVLRRYRVARGITAGQVFECGGQACVNAGQGAPVRLVLAVLAGVG